MLSTLFKFWGECLIADLCFKGAINKQILQPIAREIHVAQDRQAARAQSAPVSRTIMPCFLPKPATPKPQRWGTVELCPADPNMKPPRLPRQKLPLNRIPDQWSLWRLCTMRR